MGVLPVTTMYCHPFVRAEHPRVASSVVEALHPVEVRPLCQAEQERLGQGRPDQPGRWELPHHHGCFKTKSWSHLDDFEVYRYTPMTIHDLGNLRMAFLAIQNDLKDTLLFCCISMAVFLSFNDHKSWGG